jgi:hypothetical protein
VKSRRNERNSKAVHYFTQKENMKQEERKKEKKIQIGEKEAIKELLLNKRNFKTCTKIRP